VTSNAKPGIKFIGQLALHFGANSEQGCSRSQPHSEHDTKRSSTSYKRKGRETRPGNYKLQHTQLAAWNIYSLALLIFAKSTDHLGLGSRNRSEKNNHGVPESRKWCLVGEALGGSRPSRSRSDSLLLSNSGSTPTPSETEERSLFRMRKQPTCWACAMPID
jgi:hypothetical protein